MYKFVFIKKEEINKNVILVNVIELVEDACTLDTYQLFEVDIRLLYDTQESLDSISALICNKEKEQKQQKQKKYLIQFTNTGNFGYWKNGKTVEFESEKNEEIENDVYHFFYMMFSL